MQNNQEELSACNRGNQEAGQEQDSEKIEIPQNWQQIASNQIKLLQLDYLRTLQADGKSKFQGDNSEVAKQEKEEDQALTFVQNEKIAKKLNQSDVDNVDNDNDSEDQEDLIQYGYQQLDMDNEEEENSDGEQILTQQEMKNHTNSQKMTSQSPYKDLQVKMSENTHASNKSLSDKQIKSIQQSMSKLELKAPEWAKGLSDKDFLELLQGKQSQFNKIN